MKPPISVTFLPTETKAWVEPGTTVLEAARAVGVTVVAPCGGRGICGSCAVRVVEGSLAPPDELELRGLSRAPQDVRLACRATVSGPVTVRPVVHASATPAAAEQGRGREVVVGVDLGTTNVAALAVEAGGGREVGHVTVPNQQQSWGSDVLTRASAALAGEQAALRQAALRSVGEAIEGATDATDRVARVVIAGNSVMAGLLANSDLSTSVVAPYPAPAVPRVLDEVESDNRFSAVNALLVPPIVSFVGGDILAGAVHTGLLYADAPTLLVDMGTNAEVLLAGHGRLWATSAPAGPAFEGAGIECGGPAAAGAVTAVSVSDGELALQTIHDGSPQWFSGAGLLSAIAALRRVGALEPDGLLRPAADFAKRLSPGDDGVLRFAFTDGDACLTISQLDIRSVQLAKAAVSVGISSVLKAAGIQASALSALYVAGAFGGALCADDLRDLGIVPISAVEAVRYVGNASLQGATAMALDPATLDDAVRRAGHVVPVELASDPGFTAALMAGLRLEPYDV